MTREDILAFITEIGQRMTEIAQAGATESRSLTDPEQGEWDQLEEWLTEARKIDDRFAAAERAIAAGQATPAVAPRQAPNVNRDLGDPFAWQDIRWGTPVSQIRAQAVTAIESMRGTDDATRSELVRVLERYDNKHGDLARHVLVTGAPEYAEAFREAVFGEGFVTERQRQLLVESRASIALSTGFSFPVQVDPTILQIGSGVASDIRRMARVDTVVGPLKVNTIGQVSASRDSESAEVSDDTPADDTVTITPDRVQAWVQYTLEADQDIAQLEADLREALTDAKLIEEATAFTTGTNGFVTGSTNAVDTVGSTVFALADVYALYDAVPPRFQDNLSWAANNVIYNKIRQFDTAGGAGLWATIGQGNPATLMDHPVGRFSVMSSAHTTAGADIMVAGDFRRGFRIVDRVGMFVESFSVLGSNRRPTGEKGLYAFWRNGCGVVAANALRTLNVKA